MENNQNNNQNRRSKKRLNIDSQGYGNYLFQEINYETTARPKCISCGDLVKTIHYDGIPKYARHCGDCYAELMYGKIYKGGRKKPI